MGSDGIIADLHAALLRAFGWSNTHLHRFVIHGKDDGSAQRGRLSFADAPTQVQVADRRLRSHER